MSENILHHKATEASLCHFVICFRFANFVELVKSTLKLEKSTLMLEKSTLKLEKSTLISEKSTLKLVKSTLKLEVCRADKVANVPMPDTGMTARTSSKIEFDFDVAIYKL